MSLSGKFRDWLEKQTTSREYGWRTEVARKVGLDRSYTNRILNKKRPGRIGLDALDAISKHLDCEPWQVVWMVERGVPELPIQMRRPRRR